MISGGLAVAAIIVVQGAGVAETAPNPDGTRSNPGRDFRAQGVANLAAGLFGGQPVGGSVGATALNRSVGARSRWATVWSGVGVALVLVVFSTGVGYVLLPTLAAFLVYAAIKSFKPGEIWSVAHAGTNSLVAFSVTLVATLLLPVAAAVGIGVGISLMLQLNQEAVDLRVVELYPCQAISSASVRHHVISRTTPSSSSMSTAPCSSLGQRRCRTCFRRWASLTTSP